MRKKPQPAKSPRAVKAWAVYCHGRFNSAFVMRPIPFPGDTIVRVLVVPLREPTEAEVADLAMELSTAYYDSDDPAWMTVARAAWKLGARVGGGR